MPNNGHRRSNVSHLTATTECVEMDIRFDRHPAIYMAGEKVRGTLILEVPHSLNSTESANNEDNDRKMSVIDDTITSARDLTVSVLGEAQNAWVSKTSDKIYESSEKYLNQGVALIDQPTEFSAGQHEFAFEFDLPQTLASSYESEYGRIRYIIHASFYLNSEVAPSLVGRSDAYVERQFGVVSRLCLSAFPATQQPVEAIDATDYSCCCLPLGSVRAVITIPKNGFATNEAIPINAVVFNGTRKKIKQATINLIQQAKFVAWSRYENAQDTKERQYIIATIDKGTIEPRKFLRMDKELLTLPFLVPTYHGSIISISYTLRFEADPGLEVAIPITIGTTEE